MGKLTGTLEDREEIRELYAQYAHTLDAGRFEDWLECFAEDGAFESERFGRYEGHDGLRRFVAAYRESLAGTKPVRQMSNLTVSVEGDRATGGCYFAYYYCKEGRTSLSAVGRYIDRLRKVNGEWKFESRQVVIDGRHT